MSPHVGLYPSQDKVTDLECSLTYILVVVSTQGLLVLSRVKERHVPCLLKLVGCVFERRLVPFLIIGPDTRRAVVKVGREDRFRSVDHEERSESRGTAGTCSPAPEHGLELRDPSPG